MSLLSAEHREAMILTKWLTEEFGMQFTGILLMAALLSASALTSPVMAEVSDDEINRLISEMTLEEKAGLTSGASMWTTKAVERLGIPSITMTDGPHGVRLAASGQFGGSIPATCYPTAVTLAATWNTNLIHEVGSALGRESQAMDVQILLGPGTNIKRSPYGGRNFEYFSEDPVLSGKFSTAFIQGVQSEGVGVSLKHYAVNDQEFERMVISAEVSQRAMHEIYLRPFEMAVREAQPTTLMSAYNKVNGTFASSNSYLLDEVLRKDWGFDGIVVSDWGAVDDRVQSIRARLHLQMPADGGIADSQVVAAVNSGDLDEEELDEVLRPLLRIILSQHEKKGRYSAYDQDSHHALAYKAASEGIVLLKNEKRTLPLKRRDKVAVIGNFARVPRYQGSGSSLVKPTKIDNLVDHLAGAFAPGYDLLGNTTPALIKEAKKVARAADKVVLVIGLTFQEESEGFDRTNFGIAPGHLELLEAVADVSSRLIVVLQNGSPVSMPWLGQADAVVEAYLGGQASGSALADVLTGKVNPSGKLAETFPARIEDNPTYIAWAGEEGKSFYNEGIFVGYRYYDKKKIKPLFPFGFGLSYTSFKFENMQVARASINNDETVSVSVDVRNTGKVPGQEVVQLYVRDVESSLARPEKELKHFAKVMLEPGERKTVSFELSERDFAFYSERHQQWISESGDFTILAGNSSQHLPLQRSVSLTVLDPPKPVFTRYSLLKEVREHPVGMKLIEDLMSNLFGGAMQGAEAAVEMTEEQRVEALKMSIMMESLMGDMPIKNLVKFSQGQMTDADLDNILLALNQ